MKPVLRRFMLAVAAVMCTGTVFAQSAQADPLDGLDLPGTLPVLPGGSLLPNGLPQLPTKLLQNPIGDTGTVDNRDFGTPTKAPGKVCPFTGNVPVSVPLVNSPVGTALPGLGGYTLPQPALPSSMYTELCMSQESYAAAQQGHPPAVLVLVHGITYGTWYWDSPYQPDKYSVVNDLVKHGYATLNLDRIGEGRSGHPLSAAVTADTNAETVHQLIGKLRNGEIGGTKFSHVGLVGHSYGTVTSWLETAKYNDADTVIGTGYGNRFKFDQGALLFGGLIPAALQPNFPDAAYKLDPGYLSFRPGVRANSPFFYKPDMDPAIFDVDERLQNPVTATELGTFFVREYDGTHKNIRTPTFIINGEHDSFFCGSGDQVCATEQPHDATPEQLEQASKAQTDYESPGFGPQACLRTAVIPDAGHNINFHENSNQVSATIAYFADQSMGTQGTNTAPYRQLCANHAGDLSDILPEIGRLLPPTNVLPLPPLPSPLG